MGGGKRMRRRRSRRRTTTRRRRRRRRRIQATIAAIKRYVEKQQHPTILLYCLNMTLLNKIASFNRKRIFALGLN